MRSYDFKISAVLTAAVVGTFTLAPSSTCAAPRQAPANITKSCPEQAFLDKMIETRSLGGVLEWHFAKGEGSWRAPEISTPINASAQVVLLHLWAHWCVPCKKDFAIYSALATRLPQQLGRKYGAEATRSQVQFLYLAEDTPNNAMRTFLAGDKTELLRGGGNFQDTGGQFMKDLQRQFGCTISLPLTLLLDHRQRVQAAFVGSIESRREELLDTLIRLAKPPGVSRDAQEASRTNPSGGPS